MIRIWLKWPWCLFSEKTLYDCAFCISFLGLLVVKISRYFEWYPDHLDWFNGLSRTIPLLKHCSIIYYLSACDCQFKCFFSINQYFSYTISMCTNNKKSGHNFDWTYFIDWFIKFFFIDTCDGTSLMSIKNIITIIYDLHFDRYKILPLHLRLPL